MEEAVPEGVIDHERYLILARKHISCGYGLALGLELIANNDSNVRDIPDKKRLQVMTKAAMWIRNSCFIFQDDESLPPVVEKSNYECAFCQAVKQYTPPPE